MGVITWSPLAGGWLTGRWRQGQEPPPSTRAERLPRRYDLSRPENQRKLEATESLARLAEEAGTPLIQLAIAFVLLARAATRAVITRRFVVRERTLIVGAGRVGAEIALTEEAFGAEGPCDADIAFMTREVTGKSSSGNPTPELKGFDTVVRKSPRLKWLQIHPAGAERPIYRELRDRGVKVTTASGATAITVAHSTLGALITLNRRFPLLADAQRRHGYEQRGRPGVDGDRVLGAHALGEAPLEKAGGLARLLSAHADAIVEMAAPDPERRYGV